MNYYIFSLAPLLYTLAVKLHSKVMLIQRAASFRVDKFSHFASHTTIFYIKKSALFCVMNKLAHGRKHMFAFAFVHDFLFYVVYNSLQKYNLLSYLVKGNKTCRKTAFLTCEQKNKLL